MPGSVPERHAGSFTVDVDSHVYEPPEIWDRYVPADLRGIAKSAFFHEVDDQGNRLTIVNGVPGRELNRSRLVRQAIWKPGMTVDDIGALDPDVHVPLNPGASNPQARLADMNAMGVDQAVVFPTLFNEYLPLVQNPQAAAALTQGYNDWIWDFAAQSSGRVHPVAILPLHSLLLTRDASSTASPRRASPRSSSGPRSIRPRSSRGTRPVSRSPRDARHATAYDR